MVQMMFGPKTLAVESVETCSRDLFVSKQCPCYQGKQIQCHDVMCRRSHDHIMVGVTMPQMYMGWIKRRTDCASANVFKHDI